MLIIGVIVAAVPDLTAAKENSVGTRAAASLSEIVEVCAYAGNLSRRGAEVLDGIGLGHRSILPFLAVAPSPTV